MNVSFFDVFSYVGDNIAIWYFALFIGLFIITNISRFNKMPADEFKKSLISSKMLGLVVLLIQVILIISRGMEAITSYTNLPQYCIENNSGWLAILSFGIYIIIVGIIIFAEFRAPLVFYKYKKLLKLLFFTSVVTFAIMMMDLALLEYNESFLKSWSITLGIHYFTNVALLILSAFRTFVTKNQAVIYSNTSMHWERIEISEIKEVQINDGFVILMSNNDEVITTNIKDDKIEEIRYLINKD